MAEVAIPLMLIGGTIGAIGAYNQGKSAYQSSIYNAQIDEQNAQQVRQQGFEEERRQRVISRKMIGDIRSGYGASGVTLEGSAADVLEDVW